MARRGESIENPITRERITLLQTTQDTDGELLRFEYVLPPRFSIPEHVHVRQEERHEVLSGILRGRVGGQERDYGEGQRVVGPAGVPHAWANPSDGEELRIVSELRPALHMEALLETYFAVAQDFKTDKLRVPKHLLRMAMLIGEVKDEFYWTGVPMPVQRAFLAPFGTLVSVSRFLGYRASHPEYSGPDTLEANGSADGRVAGLALVAVGVVLGFALIRWRSSRR
jgi:quercetin dioxygenase-like cupin family protein